MAGYKIGELTLCQCRFPITPHSATSHLFCGAYAPNPLKPWCEQHRLVVFESRAERAIRINERKALIKSVGRTFSAKRA